MSDIRTKILALRNMVEGRGASEAEAMAALAKADKLMLEHGLTEDDLKAAEAKRDMRQGEFKYGIKTMHPCAKYCSLKIGEFCDVVVWYSKEEQASKAFGFSSDVDMFEFLIQMIHDTMNREWQDYLPRNPKREGVSRHTEYWSFMLGMSERINERIDELLDNRMELIEHQSPETGTDIIVLKLETVEAGLSEMFPDLKLRTTHSRGIRASSSAMDQGRAAGDRVNLNRPLETNGGGRKALK